MNEIICLQIIWLFSKGDSGGPIVIDFNKGRLSGFENSCRFMSRQLWRRYVYYLTIVFQIFNDGPQLMYRMRENWIAQYLIRSCQKLFALHFETLEIVRNYFAYRTLSDRPVNAHSNPCWNIQLFFFFCQIFHFHCVYFFYFWFVVQKRNKQSGKILSLASNYNGWIF